MPPRPQPPRNSARLGHRHLPPHRRPSVRGGAPPPGPPPPDELDDWVSEPDPDPPNPPAPPPETGPRPPETGPRPPEPGARPPSPARPPQPCVPTSRAATHKGKQRAPPAHPPNQLGGLLPPGRGGGEGLAALPALVDPTEAIVLSVGTKAWTNAPDPRRRASLGSAGLSGREGHAETPAGSGLAKTHSPPAHINLSRYSVNPSATISSILSPRLPPATPPASAPAAHHPRRGLVGGYFGSFKNLVGLAGPGAIHPLESQEHSPPRSWSPTHSPSATNSLRTSAATLASGSSSTITPETSIRPGHASSNRNSSPRPLSTLTLFDLRSAAKARAAPGPGSQGRPPNWRLAGGGGVLVVKPRLKGFVNTCGPVPVVSKFVGPKSNTTQGADPNANQAAGARQEPKGTIVASSPNRASPGSRPDMPPSATLNREAEQHLQNRGAGMTRIQKKLLMERDRPISPTFTLNPTSPTGTGPTTDRPTRTSTWPNQGSGAGGVDPESGCGGGQAKLPPPSYLVKSLGRQTGPLPLFPIISLRHNQPVALHRTPAYCFVGAGDDGEKTGGSLAGHGSGPADVNPNQATATPTAGVVKSVGSGAPDEEQIGLGIRPKEGTRVGVLNEPASKAKQAEWIRMWRNSLIDEVESVLGDHESNGRFRDPLIESLDRVMRRNRMMMMMMKEKKEKKKKKKKKKKNAESNSTGGNDDVDDVDVDDDVDDDGRRHDRTTAAFPLTRTPLKM